MDAEIVLFELESLPREIVDDEVLSRLSGPSALSFSLTNKRFNALLFSEGSALSQWLEGARDFEQEPPIYKILLECATLKHWRLFEFFTNTFARSIRTFHPRTSDRLAQLLYSASQIELYNRFCAVSCRRLFGSKADLLRVAERGRIETLKAFAESHFAPLKDGLVVPQLLTVAAKGGHLELFDGLLTYLYDGSGESARINAALQLLLHGHFDALKAFCVKWNLSEAYVFSLVSVPESILITNSSACKILRRKRIIDPTSPLVTVKCDARDVIKSCCRAGNYELVDATMLIDAIGHGQIDFFRSYLSKRMQGAKIDMSTLYPNFKEELIQAVVKPCDWSVIEFAMEVFGLTIDDLKASKIVLSAFHCTLKEMAFVRALEAVGVTVSLEVSPSATFTIKNLSFLFERGSLMTSEVLERIARSSSGQTLSWALTRYPSIGVNLETLFDIAVHAGRYTNVKYLLTVYPGPVKEHSLFRALAEGHFAVADLLVSAYPVLLEAFSPRGVLDVPTLSSFVMNNGTSSNFHNALRWLLLKKVPVPADLVYNLIERYVGSIEDAEKCRLLVFI